MEGLVCVHSWGVWKLKARETLDVDGISFNHFVGLSFSYQAVEHHVGARLQERYRTCGRI